MRPSKTITWEDPLAAADAVAGMSGLEALEAIHDGRLRHRRWPSLGMEPVVLAHGRAVFQATPDESHLNPIGAVHGCLAATLLDSAMGCAAHGGNRRGAGDRRRDGQAPRARKRHLPRLLGQRAW